MKKKLILGLIALNFCAAHAEDLYKGAKEAMICETSITALKNSRWYKKKEENLFNDTDYHDPVNGRYLFYIDTYSVMEMSKPNNKKQVSTKKHLRCRHYKSVKK